MQELISFIEDAYKRGVRVFHFAGMIGSGKSSLIGVAKKKLAEERGYKVVAFYEPIPAILRDYLADPEKYATPLQRAFLALRMGVDSECEILQLKDPHTLILVERGPNENTVFVEANRESGCISAKDAAEMITQSKPQCERECEREGQVFVLAEPERCHERIQRRDRPGEREAYVDTPGGYVSRLHELWNAWKEEMETKCTNTYVFDNNGHTPELANSTQSV